MMPAERSLLAPACLAVVLVAGGAGRSHAAESPQSHLEPVARAWMGVVALLGEQEGPGERPEHRRDTSEGRERRSRPANRGDVTAMLEDIVGRLSRIEAMLAGRGPMAGHRMGPPGGHQHGGWHGPNRWEMQAMMEASMRQGREKMREAGEQWAKASPEEREAMRKERESRMQENRDRMRAAREQWAKASPEEREAMRKERESRTQERRERMEAARAEGNQRTAEAAGRGEEGRVGTEEGKPRMEEARQRFRDMEKRIRELEAELARMKKAVESDD